MAKLTFTLSLEITATTGDATTDKHRVIHSPRFVVDEKSVAPEFLKLITAEQAAWLALQSHIEPAVESLQKELNRHKDFAEMVGHIPE
jgi:hypothetical protein